MIQLRARGLTGPVPAGALDTLAAEFGRFHCVRLPRFLDAALLQLVQRHLARAVFQPRSYEKIGTELCMEPNHLSGLLAFLLNNRELFETIRRITGCLPIGHFEGRVYRMLPSREDHDDWHRDADRPRMIGISVNLSDEVFQGGKFQLREGTEGPALWEIANTGFGDAFLFRISEHLYHRVTVMEGAVAKTAYVGWFFREENWHPVLRAGAEGRLADGSDAR